MKYAQQRLPIQILDIIFHTDLVEAFCEANIPLYKLNNKKFKNFLQKYTGRKIQDESNFRKTILEKIYLEKRNKFINEMSKSPIYIIFDETTDRMKRYILNILIGICDPNKRTKPILIKTVESLKTNADNVNSSILNLLNEIYGADYSLYLNIKLLLSDAAPYAKKAGNLLKQICQILNMLHALYMVYIIYMKLYVLKIN